MKRVVKIREALSFEDVSLEPAHLDPEAGKVDLRTRLTRTVDLQTPFISLVGTDGSGDTLYFGGGALAFPPGLVFKTPDRNGGRAGVAIELGPDLSSVGDILKKGVDFLLIQTPHGDCTDLTRAVKMVKADFPETPVIAGQVSTPSAVHRLVVAGADAVVIGSRGLPEGVGLPVFQSLLDCYNMGETYGVPLIADLGGLNSGDVLKALAAGASAVLLDGWTLNWKSQLDQLLNNLRAGMLSQGVTTIKQLSEEPVFITNGAMRSHPLARN